jgi:hypothetical protein
MTKAYDLAVGGVVDTTNFVTKSNGAIEALDGSALTNLTADNLDDTGTIPSALLAGVGGGVINQVVESKHNQNSFTTSNSFTDLFQVAITPSSTSSKILVFLSGQYNLYGNGASTSGIGSISITDVNDTQLSNTYLTNVFTSNTGQMDSSFNLSCIHEPSSTSQVIYKCRYKASSSGQRLGIMGGSARENGTRLLALEILT